MPERPRPRFWPRLPARPMWPWESHFWCSEAIVNAQCERDMSDEWIGRAMPLLRDIHQAWSTRLPEELLVRLEDVLGYEEPHPEGLAPQGQSVP